MTVAWHSEKSHIKAYRNPCFFEEEKQLAATSNSFSLTRIGKLLILYAVIINRNKSRHTQHTLGCILRFPVWYVLLLLCFSMRTCFSTLALTAWLWEAMGMRWGHFLRHTMASVCLIPSNTTGTKSMGEMLITRTNHLLAFTKHVPDLTPKIILVWHQEIISNIIVDETNFNVDITTFFILPLFFRLSNPWLF